MDQGATDRSGTLYVVATPIGNLGDLTQRARETLERVDVVAAEDTRHSRQLLQHLGLSKRLMAVHDHNESGQVAQIRSLLASGSSVALVSDAGTPLISDPGYTLVSDLRAAGFRVVPVPGPSAVITALSAAGIPCDRFVFEGFLPAKGGARRKALELLEQERRTMVFYESPHRIQDCLQDLASVFGKERHCVLARELTKTFETFLSGRLSELQEALEADPNQRKGEFVVIVQGRPAGEAEEEAEQIEVSLDDLLRCLLPVMPVKQAVSQLVTLTGLPKNRIYERALLLKESS